MLMDRIHQTRLDTWYWWKLPEEKKKVKEPKYNYLRPSRAYITWHSHTNGRKFHPTRFVKFSGLKDKAPAFHKLQKQLSSMYWKL